MVRVTDPTLSRYLDQATARTGYSFPRFAEEASAKARILLVLQNPANSGATETGKCSLDNPDPTARRMQRTMESAGLSRKEIIPWNFYAAYDAPLNNRTMWASELEQLMELLDNLRVVIAFGDKAWLGMRDVRLPASVQLIGAPHPSNRSCNSNPNAEAQIEEAWRRSKTAAGM